jgi:hypothetical protein
MGYLNPLLQLPAGQALLELPADVRAPLERVLRQLRDQANQEAENAWKRRKGPMAAYWRAVATYARHSAHALAKGATIAPRMGSKHEGFHRRWTVDLASGLCTHESGLQVRHDGRGVRALNWEAIEAQLRDVHGHNTAAMGRRLLAEALKVYAFAARKQAYDAGKRERHGA